MRTSVLLPLALLIATSASAEVPSTPAESAPPPGTLEWIKALDAVGEGFRKEARSALELVEQYRPLLALYEECTTCKKQAYRQLEHQLELRFHDKATLLSVQLIEFANDPVSLGRVLVEAGQPGKAKAIVTEALKHEQFVEPRLELLEVLASAQVALGELREARSLAERLLAETPVSRDYCEHALKWRVWLGEIPLADETFLDPRAYATKIERLHDLERERGKDS
jgi:tetratricopeptide (TPR) repeat protein